jgi:general secretion pathway protein M
MSTPSPLHPVRAAWQLAWQQRSLREQRLLSVTAVVLLLATTWSLALAPALRTWQEAPTQQAHLDAQTQAMRQLQAQAKGLQKPNPISRNESAQWLEKNLSSLGPSAKISVQGERATLSIDATTPEALARWLGMARERALALPVQAQLQHGAPQAAAQVAAQANKTPKPVDKTGISALQNAPLNDVVLRGSLVLRLP